MSLISSSQLETALLSSFENPNNDKSPFAKQIAPLLKVWEDIGAELGSASESVAREWRGLGQQIRSCQTETGLGFLCQSLMNLAKGAEDEEAFQPLASAALTWVRENGDLAYRERAAAALRMLTGNTIGFAEGAKYVVHNFAKEPVRPALLIGMGSAVVAKSLGRFVGARVAAHFGLGPVGKAATLVGLGTGAELTAFTSAEMGYQAATGHEIQGNFASHLLSGAALLLPMHGFGAAAKFVKGTGITSASLRAGIHFAGATAGTYSSAFTQGQSLSLAQTMLGASQLMVEGKVHGGVLGLSRSFTKFNQSMALETAATLSRAANYSLSATKAWMRSVRPGGRLPTQTQLATPNGALPAHALDWGNGQSRASKSASNNNGRLFDGAFAMMDSGPGAKAPTSGTGRSGRSPQGRTTQALGRKVTGHPLQFMANTLTATNLGCGLLGLYFAVKGDPVSAALWGAAGNIPDAIDGAVARKFPGPAIETPAELAKLKAKGATSQEIESLKRKILRRRAGGLWDSTADGISFGVAPAAAFLATFGGADAPGYVFAGAAAYTAGALWRLTKYDAYDANPWLKPTNARPLTFNGLASPGAAALAAGLVIAADQGVFRQMGVPTDYVAPAMAASMTGLGVLMNTRRVQWPHFARKVFGPTFRTLRDLARRRAPGHKGRILAKAAALPIIATGALTAWGTSRYGVDFSLLGAAAGYVGYGPYETLQHHWRTYQAKQRRSNRGPDIG